jgi:hypothetical protein
MTQRCYDRNKDELLLDADDFRNRTDAQEQMEYSLLLFHRFNEHKRKLLCAVLNIHF